MNETNDQGEAIVIEFRRPRECFHNALLVDDETETVTCKSCGERVSAFFAIRKMMTLSDKWRRQRARAELEREEAEKKTRTRCEHCNEMTSVRTTVRDFKVLERAEALRKEGE